MELYKALLIVGGAFIGLSAFTAAVVKFAEPIKSVFTKIKKTDNIEKNYADIKKLDSENFSQNRQIEILQEDITLIGGRLGKVEGKLDTISVGIKHLLGTSLGYVNDPKGAEKVYRNL